MAKDSEVEIPSPVPNNPPPKVYTEPEPAQNSTGHPTTLSSKQSDAEPQVVSPVPFPAECQKNSPVTRSGRSIRPPYNLKDYVQSQTFFPFVKFFFEYVFIYLFTFCYSSVSFSKEGKV